MASKDLSISMLLDFYKQLLTDKQIDALDLYYNQDLSLAEIAEHLRITRQGVRDNIKRGERQLREYEKNLGLAGKFARIISSCERICANLVKLERFGLPEIADDIIEEINADARQIETMI